MGYILGDTTKDAPIKTLYNVSSPVGKGCINKSNDVKLVQYLLGVFYNNHPEGLRPQGILRIPNEMDGIYGPLTHRYLNKFQWDVHRQHHNKIMLDNRVDVMMHQNWKGSISKTYYTLYLLNLNVANVSTFGFEAARFIVPLDNGNPNLTHKDAADFIALPSVPMIPRVFPTELKIIVPN